MRASRLLSILILLQMRGRMSALALSQEFEVSIRTIYRDIDQLSAAGVPVYAERGRDGGFQLMDGYRTRLTGMTPTESDALVLAGIGSAAQDLGIGPDLAAAQLKLLASLPADSGARAQRVASRFHLDPVGWYRRTEALDLLPVLAAALWADRRVRVLYESWKDLVSRDLDPLGLVLKSGVWYLVAAVDGALRTYRVAGIRTLEALDDPVRRPARFALETYWSRWSAEFEARLLKDRATVRLSPEGLRLLRIVSPIAGEAATGAGAPAADGWITAEIPIEGVADAAGQMLHLGAEVEVLGPPELREAVAAVARAIAARYG